MSGIVERISVLIDTKGDQASAWFKKFSTDIKGADGAAGKFKAGIANVMDSAKANAGAFAAAAGAAIFAFGVKAVGAFTDTAKAAIDMAHATGLSVEQASRWIAVGDDFEVSATQLSTAIGKIGKDLDSSKWEKYGIATRDAAGDARSTNDVLLDVLDTLNNTAPAERAKVGAELLGRGWQSVAPILGKTRKEYEDMLASVEDGQVITSKEAKTAERMRLAQDRLGDAVGELTLGFGALAAEFAPLIELIADGVSLIPKLSAALDDTEGNAEVLSDELYMLLKAQGLLNQSSEEFIQGLADAGTNAETAAGYMAAWVRENDSAGLSVADLTAMLDELAPAVEEVDEATVAATQSGVAFVNVMEDQHDAAVDAAEGLWDLESATLDTDQAYQDLVASTAEANAIMADSTLTADEKATALRSLRQDQIATAEGAVKIAEAFADEEGAAEGSRAAYLLQIEKLEELKARYPLLAAEIQRYIDKLNAIPAVKNTTVTVNGAGNFSGGGGAVVVTTPGGSGSGSGGGRALEGLGGASRGGAVFNINVSAGMIVNPTQIGEQIAAALSAWWNDGGRAQWMGGTP